MTDDEFDAKAKPLFLELLAELIDLAREGKAALKRWQPLDWMLLYGPRGTEIKTPNVCLHTRTVSDTFGTRCADCGQVLQNIVGPVIR